MIQKQIKEEMDILLPRQKGNWEHNLLRCKFNAMRLRGASKEEAMKKLGY